MDFVDWGEIEYRLATERQLDLVEKVARGDSPDTIVFCTHPPVVTLGRSSKPEDLKGWAGDVVESSRGGRATYHGPEQLVIYPILDLRRDRKSLRPKDVHHYLRTLEQVLIATFHELGLKEAKALPPQPHSEDADKQFTGVWLQDKKVASIGIAVRKWVTYHGVAINLTHSTRAFQGIQPCGFKTETMTSLEDYMTQPMARAALMAKLQSSFLEAFQPKNP